MRNRQWSCVLPARKVLFLGACVFTLVVASASFAHVQNEETSAADQRAHMALKNKLNVSFDQQTLRDGIKFLGMMSGIEFTFDGVVDKLAEQKVNIKAKGLSLSSLLSLVLRQLDLTYRIREGKVVVLPLTKVQDGDLKGPETSKKDARRQLRALKKTKIEVNFSGGSLLDYLKQVRETSGAPIHVDSAAIKKAGVDVQSDIGSLNGTWSLVDALEKACRKLGLTVTYAHDVLLITTKKEAKKLAAD